jgi:hypothetical protein
MSDNPLFESASNLWFQVVTYQKYYYQMRANKCCGSWVWTRIPRAWTPVKKPVFPRSWLLKTWAYFNFEECGTAHSVDLRIFQIKNKHLKCNYWNSCRIDLTTLC